MWLLCPRYPFIEAPLFVAENRFDQNQIGDVLGVDWWPLRNATRAEQYKEYYGKLMLDAMQQVCLLIVWRAAIFFPAAERQLPRSALLIFLCCNFWLILGAGD